MDCKFMEISNKDLALIRLVPSTMIPAICTNPTQRGHKTLDWPGYANLHWFKKKCNKYERKTALTANL